MIHLVMITTDGHELLDVPIRAPTSTLGAERLQMEGTGSKIQMELANRKTGDSESKDPMTSFMESSMPAFFILGSCGRLSGRGGVYWKGLETKVIK